MKIFGFGRILFLTLKYCAFGQNVLHSYLPNSCLDIEYKEEKGIVPILKEFLWGKEIEMSI